MNARLTAASLGIAALAIGAGGAQADTVVGSPSQTNGQSNTVSQVGVQSGGGPTPFASRTVKTQGNAAGNTSTSNESIASGAPSGAVLVGDSMQKSAQGNLTIQSLQGGKTQTNAASSSQGNAMNVATGNVGDSLVIGNPNQLQSQIQTTLQGTTTKAGGAVVKGPYQNSLNILTATTTNCQRVAAATVCLI